MNSDKPVGPYPSVDRLARSAAMTELIERNGRSAAIDAIRWVLEAHRAHKEERHHNPPEEAQLITEVAEHLSRRSTPSLRRVFNLTGTVLHTNLGRALLSEAAIAHACLAMREPCNLEFDLHGAGRGERDSLVEELLSELTGAEAATIVNNNAAAVLLVLAALAFKREVVLSRGELIEIGGSFRIPDVMRSANVRLIEVGTTNRTHASDYHEAVGPRTAALMKVHTSNYKITGFVAEVAEREVAAIAHQHDLPCIVDLGSGSLIDLSVYGLPKEPVVRDALAAGADLVTFSGDKLLGGPQAGLIVGKRSLIQKIRRHPLRRALRASKLILAALESTLLAYRNPERLAIDLPTLRMLTRSLADLEAMAHWLQPQVAAAVGDLWDVSKIAVSSKVGSGSLPTDVIPSVALAIRSSRSRSSAALKSLAERLRRLPIPVLGRTADETLLLDLRCLEGEDVFLAQLPLLADAR
jgi:L-seryl-tRNA(Ser) seleniumtransferase